MISSLLPCEMNFLKVYRMLQVRVFCFIPRSPERLPRGISNQIRRFVLGIVNGMEIDDLDGGVAVTDGDHPAAIGM
jgi:hypothetical protein